MKRLVLSTACALLLVAATTAQPYGSGYPGLGGAIPVLDVGAPYMGNANFNIGVKNGTGGATGVLGLSLAPSSLFVGATEVLIDPSPNQLLLTAGFTLGGPAGLPTFGNFSVPIPLAFPPTPALAGLRVHAQAVILGDTGFTPGSPAATRGHVFELKMPPLVFVATSVGGSSDPYWFVEPLTQTVQNSGGNGFTDNVTDAVFTEGGTNLFVASSITGQVSRADLSGGAPVWSTTYSSPVGATYGIGYSAADRLLFTLTGASFGTMELVAIDGDPQSSSYGTQVGTTTGLVSGGGGVERWSLSPSGRFAAAVSVFGSPLDTLYVIDTDATSSAFLQVIAAVPIPGSGGFFGVPWRVRIAPDDSAAWIVMGAQAGQLARFDFTTGAFTDFNPGTPGVQHLGAQSSPPAPLGSLPDGLAIAHSGEFVIVSGFGGSSAFVTRIDLTPGSPSVVSATPLSVPAPFDYGSSPTLNADDSELAVTSHSNAPPELILIDPIVGVVNGRVPLPGGSNIYTALYR